MEKKSKKTLKESLEFADTNSQYKAWIILGVYFIFFIVLIISIRNNSIKNQKEYKKNINTEYDLTLLQKENYHYKYIVDSDNYNIIYEGDKRKDKEHFNKIKAEIGEEFYSQNNIYLKKEENKWNRVENPYEIITFRTYQDINNILNNATYSSKTEYDDGNKSYEYKISTSTLSQILDLEYIDIADDPNIIKITIGRKKELLKLELDFTPYFKYKGLCNEKLNVVMEYSNYGKIIKIEY